MRTWTPFLNYCELKNPRYELDIAQSPARSHSPNRQQSVHKIGGHMRYGEVRCKDENSDGDEKTMQWVLHSEKKLRYVLCIRKTLITGRLGWHTALDMKTPAWQYQEYDMFSFIFSSSFLFSFLRIHENTMRKIGKGFGTQLCTNE